MKEQLSAGDVFVTHGSEYKESMDTIVENVEKDILYRQGNPEWKLR